MAVLLDATATLSKPTGGSTGGTLNLTIASGATLLIVSVHSSTAITVSSISAGGQGMTRLGGKTLPNGSLGVDFWYLISPPIGAQTVTITSSGAYRGGAIARSYTGTATGTVFGTAQSTNVSGGTALTSPSLSSAVGELILDAMLTEDGDSVTGLAPASGQTEDVSNFIGSASAGGTSTRCGASEKAGATSTTMKWTWTFGTDGALFAVPVKPASAPTGRFLSSAIHVVNKSALHRASQW